MEYRDPWPAEIDDLYAAVGDEQRFFESLAALRPMLDAATVAMTTISATRDGPCRHVVAVGPPPEALVEYECHFHAHDVWLRNMQAKGLLVTGALICTDDLMSRDELERSYFWKAFLTRYDTVHGLAAVLETADEAGVFTFLRFHRGEQQRRFGAAEKRQVTQWLPHLRNATRLHRRLSPQIAIGKTLEQLFGDARSPLIVLDAVGRLTRHNLAWQEWSARQAEHVRIDARGQLALRDRAAWHGVTKTLRTLLHDRNKTASVRMHVGNGYQLALWRIERGSAAAAPPAGDQVIGIVELAEERRPQSLRQGFGLTPAQARVAMSLAAGKSPAETAQALGVSLATVRTHITALYDKTGSKRLGALVAKLLSREP